MGYMDADEAIMQLGGNIELVGFREVGPDKIIVVKKIVGNYARKMSEGSQFDKLTVSLKLVHSSKVEIKGKLAANGKLYNSEIVDFNLFFALDKVLGNILTNIE
jgi:hypothetical protein